MNPSIPMFFNKRKSPLDICGTYSGACFVVSNGPSLRALDLDQLKRPGIISLSINNGASTLLQRGITPQFWTMVDHPSRFVKQIWMHPGITKFIPVPALDKNIWDNEEWKDPGMYVRDCPNVVGYSRNNRFNGERFFTESSFNWGCGKKLGGCRTVLLPSIRIPYELGFRTLYLLGVDLNMSKNDPYHFKEGRSIGAVANNENTYARIIREYGPAIRKAADLVGYKIYNCNPASKLTCFEHVPFEEAIKRTLAALPPFDKISTQGMYLEWSKKKELTREQAIEAVGLTGPT